MARDYKGTSQKAEKKGEGVGGGPVGSAGGYSGRPSNGATSQKPNSSSTRPSGAEPQNPGGPNRPQNTDNRVSSGGTNRSTGSNLLLAGLAYLLLGKKSNGQKSSGLGGILRIAVLVIIAVMLFRSCSTDVGYDNYSNYGGNTGTVIATAAPTTAPTPRPTPAPTPVPTATPSLSGTANYSGSYSNNSYFSGNGGSFGS